MVDIFRKKRGMSFRKKIGVFNYKLRKIGYHKKPGLIPLELKEKLKKVILIFKNYIYIYEYI